MPVDQPRRPARRGPAALRPPGARSATAARGGPTAPGTPHDALRPPTAHASPGARSATTARGGPTAPGAPRDGLRPPGPVRGRSGAPQARAALRTVGVLLLGAALLGCGGPVRSAAEPETPASAPGSSPSAGAAASAVPPAATQAPSAAPSRAATAAPAPGAGSASPGTTSTPGNGNDASRLRTLPAGTRQVIIVQAADPGDTTATLQAYARDGGAWRPALPAMTARVGLRGFSDHKREGDHTTPAGVFGIDATMYGIAANPGVRYRYHQLVDGDWWNENSDSPGYNTLRHGPDPGRPSEPLWRISPQYSYLAVVRYNMPAAPGRGSGIFLHQGNGNATEGCVSLPQGDLLAVLRWLDPAADPQMVLAPAGWLGRY